MTLFKLVIIVAGVAILIKKTDQYPINSPNFYTKITMVELKSLAFDFWRNKHNVFIQKDYKLSDGSSLIEMLLNMSSGQLFEVLDLIDNIIDNSRIHIMAINENKTCTVSNTESGCYDYQQWFIITNEYVHVQFICYS